MGKLSIAGLVVACALLGGLLVFERHAAAFACNPTGGPCGYFLDKRMSATDNVLPDPALSTIKSTYTDFMGAIWWYLTQSADPHAHVGAAFIVDSMLHYNGAVSVPAGGGTTAGINYAKANFSKWQALVTYYGTSSSSSYGIKFNQYPAKSAFCGGKIDSAYDPVYGDAVLYYTPAYGTANCDYEYAASMPEIVFFWPGGRFAIGTLCGNIQDSANTIPSQNALPTGTLSLTCDGSTSSFTATVSVNDADGATTGYITASTWQSATIASGGSRQIAIPNSAAPPNSSVTVSLYAKDVGVLATNTYRLVATAKTAVPCGALSCGSLDVTPDRLDPYTKYSLGVSVSSTGNASGGTFALTVVPAAGGAGYNGNMAASTSGSTWSATFANLGPTNKTGTYTANWTLTANGITQPCSGTFDVVNLPYLTVYGGDVAVGASPDGTGGASTCAVNANAGAYSWNNHASGFSGAGAQYAVQALSAIVDFASDLGSAGTPGNLAFANSFSPVDPSKYDPTNGLFGGYFGATGNDCNFTSDLTGAPITVNTTIPTTTVSVGTSIIKYISGANAYVSGNVAYAGTGGWADVTKVPEFKLVVVGGDIYIDASVTQLDGIYIAEPANGSGGHIYTCAASLGNPVNPAGAGYYATCNKQLVINGAFVAKSVDFGRTYGSVGQAPGDSLASNHAAEVFNYTPELWLPRGGALPNSYASITGLPPVL